MSAEYKFGCHDVYQNENNLASRDCIWDIFTLLVRHFFLMFHGLLNQNVGCVWPVVGSATKSLGQCCRIFIELNFLQHAADIGDTWLQVQSPSTSVAEQLWGWRFASASKKSECVATPLNKNCVHFSGTPFKTCFWTLGNSCGRTYFGIVQLWLSETINYFDGKMLLNCKCPSCFQCSAILVVLEMHIHFSCCLWCFMKLTGICNKINFKFDWYSFICVLSYLLSQKGK